MDQTLPPRLPAPLESAVQRVRMAARTAAEQTVDSLGLAALSTQGVLQRDALLGAQYELNRKLAVFALSFNEALETDVARRIGALVPTPGPAVTPESLVASWESLSLVDDQEVEMHLSADRFALEIGHACEWEIREFDTYAGALLAGRGGEGDARGERNPLRPEVVAHAMVRAIAQVADRPEVRKVLATEIGRSLAVAMRQTYADIVADLRRSGCKPSGLMLRPQGAAGGAATPGRAAVPDRPAAPPEPGLRPSSSGRSASRPAPLGACPSGEYGAAGAPGRLPSRSRPSRLDAAMVSLIRRLNADSGLFDAQPSWPAAAPPHPARQGAASSFAAEQADNQGSDGSWADAPGPASRLADWGCGADQPGMRPIAPNLIVAHRTALHQAASGALDRRVIDLVASLFDQILTDDKVPPQVARQIARLQLPVLRAALGDSGFFSSPQHPVRRFINRIASLGSAVDDFDAEAPRALLRFVCGLVQQVVDGDFEHAEAYEQKLGALDSFIAGQARDEVQSLGDAPGLLDDKEHALRVQQQFAKLLDEALEGLPVPDYLRGFMAGTWSQAIAQAEQHDGARSAQAGRMRDAGRALMLSVQPKGSPVQRQNFVRALPQLMKDLNHGLDLLKVPESSRQQFFAQLLPAHAQSLKVPPLSTLEHNLLAHRVDMALATPLPCAADLPPAAAESADERRAWQGLASSVAFSAAEAQSIGLLDETAVDWSDPVDIDLGQDAEAADPAGVDIEVDALPPGQAPEPSRGKALADHLQLGQAYRMHLDGQWRKVRLSHVSAGRGFFVFTHGQKQRSALSLTYRMLLRLCEAGRLRGFENAQLLERATARARRQLAALLPVRR